MRKITLIIVGLLMSIVASASTLQELNYNNANLGEIKFDTGCYGVACKMSNPLSKVNGKIYVDYVVFDPKGNLSTKEWRMEKVKTAKTPDEADAVVTMRPIAMNENIHNVVLYRYIDDKSWKAVDANLSDKKTLDNGGTSGALLANNVKMSGASNSTSAAAGAALFFLTSNSPEGSFIYHVNVKYKNGKSENTFIRFNIVKTDWIQTRLAAVVEDLN